MAISGHFIISIDYEQICGGFFNKPKYLSNISKEQDVVLRLLDFFKKKKIRATWACIGLLFFEDKEHLILKKIKFNIGYKKKFLSNFYYFQELIKYNNEKKNNNSS